MSTKRFHRDVEQLVHAAGGDVIETSYTNKSHLKLKIRSPQGYVYTLTASCSPSNYVAAVNNTRQQIRRLFSGVYQKQEHQHHVE